MLGVGDGGISGSEFSCDNWFICPLHDTNKGKKKSISKKCFIDLKYFKNLGISIFSKYSFRVYNKGVMELALKRYHFTVDDFNTMTEQGLFDPTDRLELIEGEIIEISPIGKLHARAVNFLSNLLVQLFKGEFVVSTQNPIVLDDRSEPQPDIAILRHKSDFYKESHPHAVDVLLVIEVADTTVEYDRTIKLPKYASAGIPEAWFIDLNAERVEVHTDPKDKTYSVVKIYQRGEDAASESFPSLALPVDDILG